MRPLELADLVDLATYERVREDYRARVIAHKRDRRVAVGDRVTLLFEDRETVRYQVLEMARVERISQPARLQEELDVYNELLPAHDTLSATLFIEIPDLQSIRPELDRLIRLDECVSLVLGEDEDEHRVSALFDAKQMQEDRISAVHYLRFPCDGESLRRVADERVRARLRIDHPHYRHEAEISPPLRASLLRDLRDTPPDLLQPGSLEREPPRPAPGTVLLETATVRVRRPEHAAALEHAIVEPLTPVASLLDADAALLGDLLVAAQGVAREIVSRRGHARVAIDVDPRSPGGLRVHVVSVEGVEREG